MITILLNTDDVEAIWLCHQLKKGGLKDVRMISADELLYNKKLIMHITNGKAYSYIQLLDGSIFSNASNEDYIINRITHLPLHLLDVFKEADRNYVAQEMQAIFHCLLSSFENVLFNRSTTNGFSGNQRSKNEWMVLAKKSGFTLLPFEQWDNQENESIHDMNSMELICYDGTVFYEKDFIENDIKLACIELLNNSNELLIGISMSYWNKEWYFINASVKANLKSGGVDFIHYLIEKMQYGTVMRNTRRQTV